MSPAVLDRAVAALLDGLRPPDSVAYEVEKLIRWGACRPDMKAADVPPHFGVSSRAAVSKRLSRRGMPPACKLLAWGRLLRAFATWSPPPNGRLRAPCPLTEVAQAVHVGDSACLSNFFLRHAGLYPLALRERCPDVEAVARYLVERWRTR